jgi:hypothetical protein
MQDLHDVLEIIHANPESYEGQSSDAHLYGLAYGFPDRSLVTEITASYLDIFLTP